jgi:hypothetical protein
MNFKTFMGKRGFIRGFNKISQDFILRYDSKNIYIGERNKKYYKIIKDIEKLFHTHAIAIGNVERKLDKYMVTFSDSIYNTTTAKGKVYVWETDCEDIDVN